MVTTEKNDEITVRYFASIRELTGKDTERIVYSSSLKTVSDLIEVLRVQDSNFDSAMNGERKLLIAVNQEVADATYKISEGDEVAFFPPMTGG